MRAPRFSVAETAELLIYGRPGLLQVTLVNLSSSGAFFEVTKKISHLVPGDLVHFSVHLSSGQHREGDAVVVHIQDKGVGVQFITPDEVVKRVFHK